MQQGGQLGGFQQGGFGGNSFGGQPPPQQQMGNPFGGQGGFDPNQANQPMAPNPFGAPMMAPPQQGGQFGFGGGGGGAPNPFQPGGPPQQSAPPMNGFGGGFVASGTPSSGGGEDDMYGGLGGAPVVAADGFGTIPENGPAVHNPYGGGNKPPPTAAGAAMGLFQRPIGTSAGLRPPGTGMMRPPGTASGRPMTGSAGFQKVKTPGSFDPLQLNSSTTGPAPPLQKRVEVDKEYACKTMERGVHEYIEASAAANAEGDHAAALEKAKEASRRERQLCKEREKAQLVDQINIDLTYATCFNLANQYHANGMYTEALTTYSTIVRSKQYPQAGRLRVNMGNIYFEQKNYTQAIKMYRMALDQIPNTGKEIRYKIMRNIGNAFVRLGQYSDAVKSFESVLEGRETQGRQRAEFQDDGEESSSNEYLDFQTGFNLVLCYFALGHKEKLRKGFAKLVSIGHGEGGGMAEEEELSVQDEINRNDTLQADKKARQREAERLILTAAKLIAPVIDPRGDVAGGYVWLHDTLQQMQYADIATEVEMCKAIHYLKTKEFEKAIDCLKQFSKKEPAQQAKAAANLSFIYYLEGEHDLAKKYAKMAVENDNFNARALVNLGNCFMHKVTAGKDGKDGFGLNGAGNSAHNATEGLAVLSGDAKQNLEQAAKCYESAIKVEADCVEAVYNLGLSQKRAGNHTEALKTFKKCHTIVPDSVEVLYQLADLSELLDDLSEAVKWYQILQMRVPTDPGVLAHLAAIHSKDDNEPEALHCYEQSYRYFPVNIDVVSALGAHNVSSDLYEKAIQFFSRASQIQPKEVKWKLMVASCHRRIGAYQAALKCYRDIHKAHADNVECLKYLVNIHRELGMKEQEQEYQAKLSKVQRAAHKAAKEAGGEGKKGSRRKKGAGGAEGGSLEIGADTGGQDVMSQMTGGGGARGMHEQHEQHMGGGGFQDQQQQQQMGGGMPMMQQQQMPMQQQQMGGGMMGGGMAQMPQQQLAPQMQQRQPPPQQRAPQAPEEEDDDISDLLP